MDELNRILIYKRTHTGDPNEHGEFGINDCMGQIRNYSFDAVIGVGGISLEPKRYKIDGKVTWVGVGPNRATSKVGKNRASIVTFDKFTVLDHTGPLFQDYAPSLSVRLFDDRARFVFSSLSSKEIAEARRVIRYCLTLKSLEKVSEDYPDFSCRSCHSEKPPKTNKSACLTKRGCRSHC